MERAVIALCRLLLLLALGVFALGYVCRDRVGAAVFSRAISQRRGLSCSQPQVNVAASLNYVRLSPLHCQVSEGPVRAFETGVTHLRLLRLRVRSAELESATVDYQERDVSHVKASLPNPNHPSQQLRRKLLGSMLDASEMYSLDAPSIRVKTLTVTRAGRVQFVMHAFRKSLDGSWDRSQAEWVECPADASLELRTLDMRVVPGWGKREETDFIGLSKLIDSYLVDMVVDLSGEDSKLHDMILKEYQNALDTSRIACPFDFF